MRQTALPFDRAPCNVHRAAPSLPIMPQSAKTASTADAGALQSATVDASSPPAAPGDAAWSKRRMPPAGWSMATRWRILAVLVVAMLPVMIADAHAQSNLLADLLPPGNASMSGRIVQLFALLTVLSIAPGLLIMVTSFTRFAIALSFLRSGLGLQSTPANLVLISLSLFMTFFVMAPTFDRAWRDGIVPLTQNAITEEQAYDRITAPFREFMLAQVRPKDLQLFTDLAANARDQGRRAAGATRDADGAATAESSGSAQQEDRDSRASAPAAPSFIPTEAVDLRVLIPAFMISELRRGFEIGFLIALPFLVIDMVVATLIMSMGMMMLPPSIISLPFKVLFFVLIDGWNMLIGGLVRSYY